METKENIKKEIISLYDEGVQLIDSFKKKDEIVDVSFKYQHWYTQALRVIQVLAPDRYDEFRSYYEIDPKRKGINYGTYVIQDYLKNVCPVGRSFETKEAAYLRFFNQLTILNSLSERVDSALANINAELVSEIQDAELSTARKLMKVSLRAAGSLTGVVIENHLQMVAKNHTIPIKKKNPTISDLNDPMKSAGIIDTPMWRKIQYLSDIRNICSHKKDVEPTKEQVIELIDGANWLIKNLF